MVELTGYKSARKQCEDLKLQRITFHTNRAGHPRVARAVFEGGKKSGHAAPAPWSPSWGEGRHDPYH